MPGYIIPMKPEVKNTVETLREKAFDRKKGYAETLNAKTSKLIGSKAGSIELVVERAIKSARPDGTEAQGYQVSLTNDGWVTKERVTLWMGDIDQSVTAKTEEGKEYLEPEKTGLTFGMHPTKGRVQLFVA